MQTFMDVMRGWTLAVLLHVKQIRLNSVQRGNTQEHLEKFDSNIQLSPRFWKGIS